MDLADLDKRIANAGNRGAQLEAIAQALTDAGTAWVIASYPDHGPTYEHREAVFDRLRRWNEAN